MRLFLVLAAGLEQDDSLTEETRARVDLAIARMRDDDHVLFSGRYSLYDHADHDTSEAQRMREHAISRGVTESSLHIEDRSQDTIENLRNSATIIRDLAPSELVIVTSWYHASRVAWLAEKFLPEIPLMLLPLTTREPPVNALLRETLALGLAEEILEHGYSLRDAHAAKEGIVPFVEAARARMERSIQDLEKQFEDIKDSS